MKGIGIALKARCASPPSTTSPMKALPNGISDSAKISTETTATGSQKRSFSRLSEVA